MWCVKDRNHATETEKTNVLTEIVKSSDSKDDFSVNTQDLRARFKFFLNYEAEEDQKREEARKVFRMTPPREDDQVDDSSSAKASVLPKPCMAPNCSGCKLRVIYLPSSVPIPLTTKQQPQTHFHSTLSTTGLCPSSLLTLPASFLFHSLRIEAFSVSISYR